ncbi:MAG: pteridine reductase [Burkholderiales bacterium]
MKKFSNPLNGKVVLVTAGARRVGAAICRRLHAAGAQVMVNYLQSAKEALALVNELNTQRADSAAMVKADLLARGAPELLVKTTLRTFGRLDALVNNASSFYPTRVDKLNENAWHDLIGVNLKAPLFIAQAAARELKKRRGCIVNIVDIHAEFPLKDYVIYSIAKGGLATLTRSLARELAPAVRVNGVSPGPILWPDSDIWKNPKTRKNIVDRTLLKRVGEPDDIARTVEFLIVGAPYITGQIIAVDGGRSIAL